MKPGRMPYTRVFFLACLCFASSLLSMACTSSLIAGAYSAKDSAGPPYTVTYRNTTSNTTGNVPVDATQYAAGATVTVMQNTGNLSWPPFIFSGWNTMDNGGILGGGGGVFYAPGATFAISANVILYGTWTQ